MKISNGFFVIENAKKLDGGAMRLKGHLLTDVVIDTDDGGSSSGGSGGGTGSRPPITFPPKFEVKWILPPRSSGAYGAIKSAAEAMGYETVEHDDFSYPGR